MITKFIKNEKYTDVYSKQPNGTLHSFSVGLSGEEYCYSSSYHHNGNFAPANFKSKVLLSEEEAKEKLYNTYKSTNYTEQPWSNN